MCELFIGSAQLIAEYNGVVNVTHVRDKIMELIAWTETTRGLLVAAAMEHRVVSPGIAVPSVTLTNIAKHHFARNYHAMVQNLQDIAGGLLVTAPFRKIGRTKPHAVTWNIISAGWKVCRGSRGYGP